MADHNERACPECGSLLHYSCKLDAAVERAYGVKYAKPWTPVVDLGAWERFALLLDGAGHGVVAALARNMAQWERERQKRGDFGAPSESIPDGELKTLAAVSYTHLRA